MDYAHVIEQQPLARLKCCLSRLGGNIHRCLAVPAYEDDSVRCTQIVLQNIDRPVPQCARDVRRAFDLMISQGRCRQGQSASLWLGPRMTLALYARQNSGIQWQSVLRFHAVRGRDSAREAGTRAAGPRKQTIPPHSKPEPRELAGNPNYVTRHWDSRVAPLLFAISPGLCPNRHTRHDPKERHRKTECQAGQISLHKPVPDIRRLEPPHL